MKKILTLLTLTLTTTNMGHLYNRQNIVAKNDLFTNRDNSGDIALTNLHQQGKFYFFNNNSGLIINETKLYLLNKNKEFITIANPDNLTFNNFTSIKGGNFGILTASDSGFLYGLNPDSTLTLLKVRYLDEEYNLRGKVTAISNTGFLVETKINNQNLIFLGKIKNNRLQSLVRITAINEAVLAIIYIRDGEVIIKTSSADYNLLVTKANYQVNQLSWQGKYFFKTNQTAWVIKDNQQLLIFNFTNNSYQELPLLGIDIIRLSNDVNILRVDESNVILIDRTGTIIKNKYHFAIANNYSLLNINSKLLLLFDNNNNRISRIIQRELGEENKLVVLKTINLTSETSDIKFLNNKENNNNSKTNFFVEAINNDNYVISIDVNKSNIENLQVNFEKIPNNMHGNITRFNKTASIFTEDGTNNLFWYQVF